MNTPAPIRLTSETGGQKEQKPERYDLFPYEIFDELADTSAPFRASRKRAFSCVGKWVAGGERRELLRAARQLISLMGGFWKALDELTRVYNFGCRKYADHNWRNGYPWSWSVAAFGRHISLRQQGQRHDKESGMRHIAHALWHVVTLLAFTKLNIGKDDRAVSTVVPARAAANEGLRQLAARTQS